MHLDAGVLWFVLPKTLVVYLFVVVQVVQGMKYLGCFRDARRRDLSVAFQKGIRNNTPETCVRFCQSNNAIYATVQHGNECYCGNSYGEYGKLDDTECRMACTGDNKKKCGGRWANGIYRTGLCAVDIGQQIICNERLTCTSEGNKRKDCRVEGAAEILNITEIRHNCGPYEFAALPVYGHDGNILWVRSGCTATVSVCYIPVRAVVLTTKPTLSSSSTTVVTTRPTNTKVSSTSTIEPVTSTLPHSTTHRYLPNTSPNKERNEHTSTSYTTNSHLMESDNTATVVLVITVTLTCICLAVVITLILCRRHMKKSKNERGVPLDAETYTVEEQSTEYSNALPVNETVTNSIQRSICLTEHGSATSNSMLDKDDKDFKQLNTNYTEGGAGKHSDFILEHQNQRESYVEDTDRRTSTSESQEIYYNEPNRNEVILTMKTVKSDAEYNTIKEVPRKFVFDPNYDTLGISKEDTELQENDNYCHTTDTLRKLNDNVIDYSHIKFQNVEGKI